MKFINIKAFALVVVAGLGLTACDDFLDKPTIDNYNADNYYSSDTECLSGTSYLYSSPWSDFTRPFIKVGEIMSENYYPGTSPYLDFTVNGSDADIASLSNSLWSVVAHCNTVYNYISKSSGPSAAGKGQTMGECLTWKAIAYFFLVRTFGDIPIIHDNSAELESGSYNTTVKVKKADVYEYIIMTLEKAIDILPETPLQAGRIDKAAAQGMLAKVYLTKAGVSGTVNADDLNNAIKFARLCLEHSSHSLMPNYSDVFRLANNINPECLISWRWNANNNQWTDQSFMQNDYAPKGFGDDDCWAQWCGMSTDLQEAFGIKILEQTPDVWINNRDTRLKATMMLPGFKYDYFWTDKGGFDFLRFIYDDTYNPSVEISDQSPWLVSPTGSYPVKHLYGDNADHTAGVGYPAARMANSLATPLLRISDVMLVLAEAKLILTNTGNPQSASTTDAEVLNAVNSVRTRAGLNGLTTVTFDDIWKERRLELAFEGDRWYDYVRVSYYNSDFCLNDLKAQTRIPIGNGTLNEIYKNYYKTGDWVVSEDTKKAFEDSKAKEPAPIVEQLLRTDADSGKKYLAIPMTERDVVFNPNLGINAEAVHVDVRSTYSY
jgi:hypothetical protein